MSRLHKGKFIRVLAYNRGSQVANSNLQIAFSRTAGRRRRAAGPPRHTTPLKRIKINLQICSRRLIVAATRHRTRHYTASRPYFNATQRDIN